MTSDEQNQHKNKDHYEKLYTNYSIKNILYWVKNLDSFLDSATTTEISWYGLYKNDFKNRIKGKRVLEMGCGDCTNAAVMAALGAEVFANDIAASSGNIINRINENHEFRSPIKFVEGDFLKNDLPGGTFDFVVGKAFLHHLTIPVEELFLKETVRLLKKEGEARFFEPAVNSKILDGIRWYIPVKGRPSKFNLSAFQKWKEEDPHPDRSFSSDHWNQAGSRFFEQVEIIPIGTLERFSRFFKWGSKKNCYKQWALKNEKHLPEKLNSSLARAQLIIYKRPTSNK